MALALALAGLPVIATAGHAVTANLLGIARVAGNGNGSPVAEGPALSTALPTPVQAAKDSVGNVYVSSPGAHRVYRITPAGQLLYFAGNGTAAAPVETAALSSPLSLPYGVAVDSQDNVYISDFAAYRVVKVTPQGQLTYFAGNGTYGMAEDESNALSTSLDSPFYLAVDPSDNVYVSDFSANQVLKITQGGMLTRFAGLPNGASGLAAEGVARSVPLDSPRQIGVDAAGNLYVASSNQNRVDKITPQGDLTFFAGTGLCPSSGEGPATSVAVCWPSTLSVDQGTGAVYVGATNSARVYKIAGGQASFFAGDGVDGGVPTYGTPATTRRLSALGGLLADNGTLWIADYIHNLVSRVGAVPLAPALNSVDAGAGQVTAHWTTPTNSGTSALTGYTLTATPANGPAVTAQAAAADTSGVIPGLETAVAYTVTVTARNTFGNGPASNGLVQSPHGPPGTPVVTLTPGNTTIDATWDPPAGNGLAILGYTVRVTTQGPLGPRAWSESRGADAVRWPGTELDNGRSYQVEVRATNDDGPGNWSTVQSATPRTTPGAPVATATPGDGSLAIAWTPPGNTGGSPITGYAIKVTPQGTNPGPVIDHDALSSDSSWPLTGLENGRSYQVEVAAKNAAGTGTWSTAVLATPHTVPGAPVVTLTPMDRSLKIDWTEPATNGAQIANYSVRITPLGMNPLPASVQPGDLSTRTLTVNQLDNGRPYRVEVLANNAAGDGGWSDPRTATPRTVPGSPPITAVTPGDQTLDISWTPPESDGGDAITIYTVRVTPQGNNPPVPWSQDVAAPAGSWQATGLDNGRLYNIEVRAKNRAGDSTWSSAVAGTPRTLPGAPVLATPTPGDQTLDIAWTAPQSNGGAELSGYTVRITPLGAAAQPSWMHETDASTTSWRATELANGRAYRIEVRAGNVAGNGGWSDPQLATPRTVPGAPTEISATPGNQTIDVSWAAPQGDGGAEVTGYTVKLTPLADGPGVPITHAAGAQATSWQATGLNNGEVYLVQVRAGNVAGDGGWSTGLPATPRTVPNVPVATAMAGNHVIDVSWTQPASGGAAVTGYTVRVTPQGTDPPSSWSHDVDSSTRSWQVVDLENGRPYQIEVLAKNAAGAGAWSDPAPATPRTVPDVPVLSADPGNTSIALSWTVPGNGGSAITGYAVKVTPQGAGAQLSWTIDANAQTVGWMLNGLDNGRAYRVEVQAKNIAGAGSWSEPATVTPRTVPDAPVVSVTPGDEVLGINWTAPADGGAAISGYTVTVTPTGPGAGAPIVQPVNGGTASWLATGLENGRSYQVTVKASNAAGDGDLSATMSGTPRTLPGTPAVAVTTGDRVLDLGWTVPSDGGAAITGYTVKVTPQGAGAGPATTQDVGAGTTSWSATGLENGRAYQVQVRAANAVGSGLWSEPVENTPRTVPDAPVVTATPADQEVVVHWTAPPNGGSAITGYTVKVTPLDESRVARTVSLEAGVTSWTAIELQNGLPYQFEVRARNVAGNSLWSDVVVVAPRTLPGAPTGVTAVTGNAGAGVTWIPPDSDGGAPITGFELQAVPQGGGTPVTGSAAAADTQAIRGGLTNGITYAISVAAVNQAGTGPWSDSASVTPVLPTALVVGTSVPGKVHVGSRAVELPGLVMISRPRTSVNVQLWSVSPSRQAADVDWRSTDPTGSFSGSLTFKARSFPAWGAYRWTFTPAAPSVAGTVDVSIRLHTLLGLNATRSGDRLTVTGSARAYHSVLDVYKPWNSRPVAVQRWTATGWATIGTVTTNNAGNVSTSFRIPFKTSLRLVTGDTAQFWGASSAEQTL